MSIPNPAYTAEEVRARLGISTVVFIGQDLPWHDLMRQIADAGIVTLEVLDRREEYQEEDPDTMNSIVEAIREAGLTVTSFHSRSVDFQRLGLEAEIERSRRMIDHLIELGGAVWGTHVQIADPATRAGYEALARRYEGQGLSLTIENFGFSGRQDIRSCIDWIDSIGHPAIGQILDVGHERNEQGLNPMTLPGEPTRILREIGPRLRHVHLHDFRDGRDHRPPFEGDLQWREVFRGLREIDYQGAFMFEPECGPDYAETICKVGGVPERIESLLRRIL